MQRLSCKFPRDSIVFLVLALFGDGADVEIAVAPVFVMLVTTTWWMSCFSIVATNNIIMLIVATLLHGIHKWEIEHVATVSPTRTRWVSRE